MKQIKDFPRKQTRGNSDRLLLQEGENDTYVHILISDLLANTSSSGGSGGSLASWQLINDNYIAQNGDRLIADNTNKAFEIVLPSEPILGTEIEITALNPSVNNLSVANVNKFETYLTAKLLLNKKRTGGKLIYAGESIGWIQTYNSSFIAIGTATNLAFQSHGDTNGVFYFIGTNKLTESWTNPQLTNRIAILYSSFLDGQDTVESIINRQGSYFHTQEQNNPYIGFDLLANKSLKLSYWSYRSRSNASVHIPNRLLVSASNDNTNYIQLQDKSFSISQNNWIGFAVDNQTEFYRYFRFTMPYYGYLTVGEFELYGDLIY